MSKLVLKFENSVLREVPVGSTEVSIGRAPDNGLVIDNPAVSHYHARVFQEEGRLMLEDFGSLNGTFVNGQRVKMVALKPGDSIAVGKHRIFVLDSREMAGSNGGAGEAKSQVPKIAETVVLDTAERREFLRRVAADGEASQVAPARVKVATLVVHRGRTNRKEYALTDKLNVVGKSEMATVKLTGWFAPRAAAQINRREDGYYIGPADRVPQVNGHEVTHPAKLSSGDIIEIGGLRLEFVYRD